MAHVCSYVKRKEWCPWHMNNNEHFEDVIFTDECTVQLDHHGQLCFYKKGEAYALKQRPKHHADIYLWGEISTRRTIRAIMLLGTINAIKYGKIDTGLVSFVTFQAKTSLVRTYRKSGNVRG